RMNNVNDRAVTASNFTGTEPITWRTVGAKVIPFSESAKSIDSFFRADAQEKARRLILPPKNTDALGGTIPLSIGQQSLLRSQKYAFFLYRQIFQNLFQPVRQKTAPEEKDSLPRKKTKGSGYMI
ncbi:hypothetical protein, partial [Porphyromonas gingivalis]|uniref:hypothetical protein n=1 Tax=Porphyromonas gingivalis TaxID=837 RepID=UPI00211AFFE9